MKNTELLKDIPTVGDPETPLFVKILEPQDGVPVTTAETVVLSASAKEGLLDLSRAVRWRSNIDGFLGTGIVRCKLSRGLHTLTATVRRPVSTARKATSRTSKASKTNETIAVTDTVSVCADPTNYGCGGG